MLVSKWDYTKYVLNILVSVPGHCLSFYFATPSIQMQVIFPLSIKCAFNMFIKLQLSRAVCPFSFCVFVTTFTASEFSKLLCNITNAIFEFINIASLELHVY